VIAKVRQRLSVSKQVAQVFDMERCNINNLNDVEVKENYQIKISSSFAAVENLVVVVVVMMM
jgi:hypothetical protein